MFENKLKTDLFGENSESKQVVAKIKIVHDSRTKLGSSAPPEGITFYGLYNLEECKIRYDTHAHYGALSLCDGNKIKSFENEKEAKEYAKKNNLKYIENIPIRE